MKKYISILAIVSIFFLQGCEEWLDLQQEGEVESENLYKAGEGYRSVLNGLYKAMGVANLYGQALSYGMVDCMSQQYDLGDEEANLNSANKAFYNFDYSSTYVISQADATWAAAFNIIANANDLIQETQKASADIFEMGEMERQMILGEAYACRALMHFEMLRLFAPALVKDDGQNYVPYVDVFPTTMPSSIGVKPFLEKVIADLLEAQKLTMTYDTTEIGILASSSSSTRSELAPVNGADGYPDFFFGRGYRLSYYATTALLARVYQYAGYHDKARECAEYVANLESVDQWNYATPFYEDYFSGLTWPSGQTPENFEGKRDYKAKLNVIFSAYNSKLYETTSVGTIFDVDKDPYGGGSSNQFLTLKVEELFDNRGMDERQLDVRSAEMLVIAMGNWMVSGKWFVPFTGADNAEHLKFIPVIRSTEMRYIMAESYAREGDFTTAYSILNEIRSARKASWQATLPTLAVQNSFDEFVTDLVADARREWISEGQLFYLYKRLDAPFLKDRREHRLTKGESCLPLPSDQR